MNQYDELFERRGAAYDRAMRRHPHARDQEFAQVVAAARLKPGDVVGDVPAGGNYLQRHLPAGCVWQGHEPCASFNQHATQGATGQALLPLPWATASVDVAVSLAGVHHLEDKRAFYAELRRASKPQGRLVISDVVHGSPVARFLDGYVGAHNSTGHEGIYLDASAVQDLEACGWHVAYAAQHDFEWVFGSLKDMADFCHTLFDLRTSAPADTLAAIKSVLGVQPHRDGRFGMHWSLMTLQATALLAQISPPRSRIGCSLKSLRSSTAMFTAAGSPAGWCRSVWCRRGMACCCHQT